jgi:hypothetical protein
MFAVVKADASDAIASALTPTASAPGKPASCRSASAI